MKRSTRTPVWNYGQRLLIEFSLVAITLGVLVALAAENISSYIKKAQLVEPVYFAQHIQRTMIIDSALTGRWPAQRQLDNSIELWQSSIESFEVNPFGNFAITLSDDLGFENRNRLGFNLNDSSGDTVYRFYHWRCGTPDSANAEQSLKSTVSRQFSHSICRINHD